MQKCRRQHPCRRPLRTALQMAQRKHLGQARVVGRTQCAPFAQTFLVLEQRAAAQCLRERHIVHRQMRQIRDALTRRHATQPGLARGAQLGLAGLLQIARVDLRLQRAQPGVDVIAHRVFDQSVVLALIAQVDHHIDQHQQQRHPGNVLARPGLVQRHQQHDNVRVPESVKLRRATADAQAGHAR